MKPAKCLYGFLVLFSLAGCGAQEQTSAPEPMSSAPTSQAYATNEQAADSGAATAGTVESQSQAAQPVELKLLDYDGIQSLIASHKGKVVVMDVWSTSCEPCIKEFPGLVALDRKHADALACISVSSDFYGIGKPEDLRDKVLQFLTKQQATFDNVLSTTPDTDLYAKLQFGSIPAVFVYGRDGVLLKQFGGGQGEFTYAKDVTPFVEQLLAQDSP